MAKESEGIHTVESFSARMGIGRGTAINYLHSLGRSGYSRASRGRKNKRLYDISPLRLRRIGHPGLIETINKYSSIKLEATLKERLDHELGPEEAVVRAMLTRDYRIILASIELFRHVNEWWELYRLSKENGIERQVGALYSLSRRVFKVSSIDKRVLALLRKSRPSVKDIVPGARSRDFVGIEKEWGVRLPFNLSDLRRLG